MTKNYTRLLHIFTAPKWNICKIICVKIKDEVGKVAKSMENGLEKLKKVMKNRLEKLQN